MTIPNELMTDITTKGKQVLDKFSELWKTHHSKIDQKIDHIQELNEENINLTHSTKNTIDQALTKLHDKQKDIVHNHNTLSTLQNAASHNHELLEKKVALNLDFIAASFYGKPISERLKAILDGKSQP